ncbi:hypothetical protein BJX63DRAFT_79046 [Aspergillus granulosus]|uniref:Secreted protein n=1 Tax=Aspergillus granulosus TaxID=176169 RepID=A0ABR4GXJ3_9EURO
MVCILIVNYILLRAASSSLFPEGHPRCTETGISPRERPTSSHAVEGSTHRVFARSCTSGTFALGTFCVYPLYVHFLFFLAHSLRKLITYVGSVS